MQCRTVKATKINTVEFVKEAFEESIQSPTEVILKNRFSHISAGTELACLAGLESWFEIPGVPGYTAIGEIIEKGEAVDQFNVGDGVYTMGPHQEYYKIDITDRWHGLCVPVPDGLDEDVAAFTHMAGIAMTSLRASSIELGDTVLVTGLGVIGNLAAQLAQLQGARVIAVDLVDHRLDVAKACGIQQVYNSKKEDIPALINKLTDAAGVNAFIDATGVSPVIEQYAGTVAFNGELILLGSPRQPYQTDLTQVLQKVHLLPHSLTMKGALEFTFPTQNDEFVKHSIERNSRIIMELMRRDELKIKPFYTHKLHPSEAQNAYDGLANDKDTYMGVVFDWLNL
ncbi:MAG: zinc-binding alcohol dehydrogenase [candidate division KSB1 bacterium]|nr:zinc-binding alcohol dehydrogenase [candidate division KSB1 bacterium]